MMFPFWLFPGRTQGLKPTSRKSVWGEQWGCEEIPSTPDHASGDVKVSLKAKSESEADEHVVDVDLGKLSVEHRFIDDA